MRWVFIVLFSFFFIAVTIAPLVTFAADAETPGLVTCGFEGVPDCDFCYFIKMANKIINWLFGFLVLAAVAMLMYAGFKMVVSQGNPSAWSDAKEMLTNVVIGFVIVISAWLIVDTLVKALVNPDATVDGSNKFGMWNKIDGCTDTE